MTADEPEKKPKHNKPGYLTIAASVLAAAFGVQSREKLERDFSGSSPIPFIIAGVVFTALFVLGLIALVKFIMTRLV